MTELEVKTQSDMLVNQERIFKMAEFLASSDIIPKHFQSKPANVFIALEMAKRLEIDFFELANGLYVVHGRPAFSGTFTIARINASKMFKEPLAFDTQGQGDQMSVTAYAETHGGTKCSVTIPMSMAIMEGWTKNTKYKSMPEQMLTYRSASFFCRKYCPQVLMGAKTVEEVEDEIIVETVQAPSVVPELQKIAEKESKESQLEKLEDELAKVCEEAKKAGIPEMTANAVIKKIKPDDIRTLTAAIDWFKKAIVMKMAQSKVKKDV